jgi:SAM-dependent methyltransferase
MPGLYDAECPWGPDDDVFMALAARRAPARIADLGCGTGRLTTALARAGHDVTGIDPNPTYLSAARAKPGGDLVTWVQGTSADLPTGAFELALMTSHVAQVFVVDDEWRAVLDDLARALVPGGLLAFDTRDPRARGWEAWTRDASLGRLTLPDGAAVETWVDVVDVAGEVVTFEWHNRFEDGDDLHGVGTLRFRSEDDVRATLERAGFHVVDVHGTWSGESVGPSTAELIVLARR